MTAEVVWVREGVILYNKAYKKDVKILLMKESEDKHRSIRFQESTWWQKALQLKTLHYYRKNYSQGCQSSNQLCLRSKGNTLDNMLSSTTRNLVDLLPRNTPLVRVHKLVSVYGYKRNTGHKLVSVYSTKYFVVVSVVVSLADSIEWPVSTLLRRQVQLSTAVGAWLVSK